MLQEPRQFLDMFIFDKPNTPKMGMSSEQKRLSDMRFLNGKNFNNGERSQGDQEAQQRMIQNMMTAHHSGGGVGLDGFKEPSLEDLVELVRKGEVSKEVLGDRADEFLEYGTPSQREKQLKDTGSLKIPVQNQMLRSGQFDDIRNFKKMQEETEPINRKFREIEGREGPDEDDLAFLKAFIRNAK
jgi:hypothetical protein